MLRLILEKRNYDMEYKISLVLSPQPEGGYTVTSPTLPELITEGDTVQEALYNAQDALAAVIETYQDLGRQLPTDMKIINLDMPVSFETIITAP
jgi:antitoxin HicB